MEPDITKSRENEILENLNGSQSTAIGLIRFMVGTQTTSKEEKKVVFIVLSETLKTIIETFNSFCEANQFSCIKISHFSQREAKNDEYGCLTENGDFGEERIERLVQRLEDIVFENQRFKDNQRDHSRDVNRSPISQKAQKGLKGLSKGLETQTTIQETNQTGNQPAPSKTTQKSFR